MTRRAGVLGAAALAAILAAAVFAARAADPDALWKIVHGRCGAGGDPAPCAALGPADAVLKDLVGHTQFLLIPTTRVTGMEDPALLAPGAPNYFADAWAARRFVEARAGHPLPREDIALAINARDMRSQDQLHIHVDCIRPEVRDALAAAPAGPGWRPVTLSGTRYRLRRLDGERLADDPFALLASELPGARAAMGEYTLVVAGLPDGFALLAGRIGEGSDGHGEDLQDHGCAVAG